MKPKKASKAPARVASDDDDDDGVEDEHEKYADADVAADVGEDEAVPAPIVAEPALEPAAEEPIKLTKKARGRRRRRRRRRHRAGVAAEALTPGGHVDLDGPTPAAPPPQFEPDSVIGRRIDDQTNALMEQREDLLKRAVRVQTRTAASG